MKIKVQEYEELISEIVLDCRLNGVKSEFIAVFDINGDLIDYDFVDEESSKLLETKLEKISNEEYKEMFSSTNQDEDPDPLEEYRKSEIIQTLPKTVIDEITFSDEPIEIYHKLPLYEIAKQAIKKLYGMSSACASVLIFKLVLGSPNVNIAELLECDPGALARYAKSLRQPPDKVIENIARMFKLKLSDLLEYDPLLDLSLREIARSVKK